MQLLSTLRAASAEGLESQRYGIAQIEAELDGDFNRVSRARAERLLTEAYRAYAHDLRVPRESAEVTYIDRELVPASPDARVLLASEDPVESLKALQRVNPIYQGLRDGLAWYRSRWSKLPQVEIPAGPALAPGSRDARVVLLRRRLGLPQNIADPDHFDEDLARAVREFREVHGLAPLPIADRNTIDAINAGAGHYEQLIAGNMDRVRGFPGDGRRYVVVDTAGATLRLIEDGREVDSMRAVVGKPEMETPELAGLIRFAVVNPYWNVPPDLVRQSIAPQVLREGPAALDRRRLALFRHWRSYARLDPSEVDWAAVAEGRESVWVRQLPGGDNMMGEVKFMLPNRLGIYLHDTPNKGDFKRADRRLSSGCVRVEDARRLALWLFRGRPILDGDNTPDQRVHVPEPVPVYITYLTATPVSGEIRFQQDHYSRDRAVLAHVASRA
jgi:murein L,D-transpeptidase YcbB/YkuD